MEVWFALGKEVNKPGPDGSRDVLCLPGAPHSIPLLPLPPEGNKRHCLPRAPGPASVRALGLGLGSPLPGSFGRRVPGTSHSWTPHGPSCSASSWGSPCGWKGCFLGDPSRGGQNAGLLDLQGPQRLRLHSSVRTRRLGCVGTGLSLHVCPESHRPEMEH